MINCKILNFQGAFSDTIGPLKLAASGGCRGFWGQAPIIIILYRTARQSFPAGSGETPTIFMHTECKLCALVNALHFRWARHKNRHLLWGHWTLQNQTTRGCRDSSGGGTGPALLFLVHSLWVTVSGADS